MTGFDAPVLAWWGGISAVAVLNLGLLAWSAQRVLGAAVPNEAVARYRRLQLLFGGLYVVGCASRSFVLRSDGARYAMIDSFFGSVFVGRSIATVAEMAFVAQWAILLHALSKRDGDRVGVRLAASLVPIIAVAETWSWMGILTRNPLYHAIEESLWTVTAALFMLGLALRLRSAGPALTRFLYASLAAGGLYLLYMVTMDVPMYVARWQAKQAAGAEYLAVSVGLGDAMTWTVTGAWAHWQHEVLWQSLYFSFAVWMSLVLIHRPLFPEEHLPRPAGAPA